MTTASSESVPGVQSHPTLQRRELTIRAIFTGMLLGAILAPCNIYAGLKIGWGFNMSVAAGLLGFAFWRFSEMVAGTPHWGLHENNINQTAASSAASISSAGLVAPIPALAILTDSTLPWHLLAFWLLAVATLGVVVAAGLRNQMIIRENLVFPSGVATAATIQQIHSGGAEATSRLRVLFAGMSVSGGFKLFETFVMDVPRWSPKISLTLFASAGGAIPASVSFANLGLALNPSFLLFGFGAISGMRVGLSALLGAIVGWGLLIPYALSQGWADAGAPSSSIAWYSSLVKWLLWPGVTLMVVAALTSFTVSIIRIYTRRTKHVTGAQSAPIMPFRVFILAVIISLLLAATAQITLFGIGLWEAVLAAVLTYLLAVVAARVAGETGITPVGALGKITQLTFGFIAPGSITTNLMTANVTGGAASQCADLLHDMRTGQIIGAAPGFQFIAQIFGVLSGALAGSYAYILLIPFPRTMLLTPEWPAPAVATWKAVAEVLSQGLANLPPAILPTMIIAAIAGVTLSLAEKFLPKNLARFVPSASAIGLSFVIPAWSSISLFLGALAGLTVKRIAPIWAENKLIVLAAGLVVGESLAGVVAAVWTLLG